MSTVELVREELVCPPRYATPRTGRPTYGGEVGRLARLLGFEPMPHQQLAWDTLLEHENGRLAYPRGVMTKPRQNGFTTAVLFLLLWRCLKWPGQVVKYAAQSGSDARAMLADTWWPTIEHSPLAEVATFRRQSGHEGFLFSNGSRLGLLSSGEKTGHGSTLDLAVLDEAWSYPDHRLEQSALPAMATRENAQLLIVSAAGTEQRSPFLWENVQAGRQAVEAGVTDGIAHLEWSAPDDADPADPETWRRAIPALGHTITEETVRAAFLGMPRHDFQRSYLCTWTNAMGDPLIDLARWESFAEPDAPRPAWVVLAVDVAPQGKSAAIVAGGEDGDLLRLSVLEHGPGTEWVPAALERLRGELGDPHVLLDGKACSAILPEIERATDFHVTELGSADIPVACEFFLKLAQEGRLRHRGEQELTIALDAAGQRRLGDGWALSRRNSGADITPLVACTLAVSFWRGSWSS